MKNKRVYKVPAEKLAGKEELIMQNGNSYSASNAAAYYGSSVIETVTAQPKYYKGEADIIAQDELKRAFKPKKHKGEFGALIKDNYDNGVRVDVAKYVAEVTTVDEVEALDLCGAETLEATLSWAQTNLKYTDQEGQVLSYAQAMQKHSEYKEHNQQINELIDKFYQDNNLYVIVDEVKGIKKRKALSESQLEQLVQIAKRKKSVCQFMVHLTVSLNHTIALKGNYLNSSLPQDKLLEFGSNFDYDVKSSYIKGKTRYKRILIPCQTKDQLKSLVSYLKEVHILTKERNLEQLRAVRESAFKLEDFRPIDLLKSSPQ